MNDIGGNDIGALGEAIVAQNWALATELVSANHHDPNELIGGVPLIRFVLDMASANPPDDIGEYKNIVHILISRDAILNFPGRDHGSYNPLDQAVNIGDAEILTDMVEHGADVNTLDNNGATLLMHTVAVAGGISDGIRWLIDNNADVSVVDNDNKTVLHHAVENNFDPDNLMPLLKLLVERFQQDQLMAVLPTLGLTQAQSAELMEHFIAHAILPPGNQAGGRRRRSFRKTRKTRRRQSKKRKSTRSRK